MNARKVTIGNVASATAAVESQQTAMKAADNGNQTATEKLAEIPLPMQNQGIGLLLQNCSRSHRSLTSENRGRIMPVIVIALFSSAAFLCIVGAAGQKAGIEGVN